MPQKYEGQVPRTLPRVRKKLDILHYVPAVTNKITRGKYLPFIYVYFYKHVKYGIFQQASHTEQVTCGESVYNLAVRFVIITAI